MLRGGNNHLLEGYRVGLNHNVQLQRLVLREAYRLLLLLVPHPAHLQDILAHGTVGDMEMARLVCYGTDSGTFKRNTYIRHVLAGLGVDYVTQDVGIRLLLRKKGKRQ